MGSPFDVVTQSPVGRIAYWPTQRLVHFVRRRANPEMPLDHAMIEVSYRKRRFSIEVRRWSISDQMAVEQCFTDAQYDMPTGAHGEYLERVLPRDCGGGEEAADRRLRGKYRSEHAVVQRAVSGGAYRCGEPAPDNFALLRRNCRGVDVDLREAGIGCVDGSAWVSDAHGGGMGYRTNEDHQGSAIQILSLATLMASKPVSEYAPFLLKVDIEGAEKSLFASEAAVLDQFPLIIMEPHDWMFPGEHTSVEFFRFHSQAGREFAMKHENVASIACNAGMCGTE